MKLKFLFLAVFMISVAMLQAQNFVSDASSSVLKWTGEKVTGKHYGTIQVQSGEFTISEDMITSGMFMIDMNSIVCEDIENEKYNAKLVGHLKSDDFFGVEKFPVATFKITGSSKIKGGNATVNGDLTIKGITQPVSFKAVMAETDGAMKIYGSVTIDRTLFDVRYGSGSFFDSLGDKTIYDDFTVKLDITAQK